MSSPIKLRADDADDLKIIAACLQDCIVPIAEICYLPEQAQFLMVVNRFKWEAAALESGTSGSRYERTNCAVSISGVTQVRRRKVDLLERGRVLNLLTILSDAEGLELVFAGDSVIQLVAPHWRCFIHDLGDPWPTGAVPCHPIEDGDGKAGKN